MSRQIHEAVIINNAIDRKIIYNKHKEIEKVRCLNRKGEHFGPRERWGHR